MHLATRVRTWSVARVYSEKALSRTRAHEHFFSLNDRCYDLPEY
jgi:hypothetical protein